MISEDVFQKCLDDNPDAHGLRLVYADWLEETGDPKAAGMRWLGGNGKRPSRFVESWAWWTRHENGRHINIPKKFWDAMPKKRLGGFAGYALFRTRRAAEDAFCAAFLAVQQAEAVAAERSELAEMETRLQRNVCKCDGGGTVCGNCRDERDVVELRRRVAQTPTA